MRNLCVWVWSGRRRMGSYNLDGFDGGRLATPRRSGWHRVHLQENVCSSLTALPSRIRGELLEPGEYEVDTNEQWRQ
eukprot:4743400-Pyramimonas_sp.AAC.1